MERQLQQRPVAIVDALEEQLAGAEEPAEQPRARRLFVGRPEPPRAEHGHNCHRDEQRHRQREDDDDGQLAEQDAGDARQKQERKEHRDVRQR